MRKRISSQERLRRGRGGRNSDEGQRESRMVLVRISNLEAEQKTSDEMMAAVESEERLGGRYRERDGQARRDMRDAKVEGNAKTIVSRERREEKKTRKSEEKLLLIKFARFECGGSWHSSPPAV